MTNYEQGILVTVANGRYCYLHKYGLTFIFLFVMCLYHGLAYATTYSLPTDIGRTGSPFSSCSFSSGTTYNCTNKITLGNNDIVNVTSPMTLNIIGYGFSTGSNVTINNNGNVFTIIATEDMDIGQNFTGSVNLTAIGKTINFGTNLNITGDVNAGSNGTLTFQGNSDDSNINGTCTPSYPQCGNPTLFINSVSLSESNTSFIFTVTMSRSVSSSVTVNYATSNGTAIGGSSCTTGVDYITKSGTATITAGSTSTQITVTVCNDAVVEANETFTVTLSSPSSGTFLNLPSYSTGTIINDDGVSLHHIEIQHGSGTGLTCAANTLTIKACQDSACTAYTGGTSGTLTATGTPTAVWDGTTGGATGAGFVIPSGSSTVTKNVQIPTAGTVVFGSTLAGTTCNFGSPSCTFTASTAGFIFSSTATGTSYTIPAQVSGITSGTLYLRALQASTTNPAVCTPAIIGQTIPVNMSYTCNNPATCQAGNLATINSTSISSSSTAVNLAFDANASAPVTIRYDDVGQITLNASKTLTPFTGATAVTLTGSSNAFVVKPDHFSVSAIKQTAAPQLANPAAASATDAKFVKAGEAFTATVTALNSANTATPNFGRETTAEGVKLTQNLVLPSGGVTGTLSNSSIAGGSFSNGVATVTNLAWDEVGIITLTPTIADADYLGTGNVTGTTSANVGRFYPDHFALTPGTVTPFCVAGDFTYFGQDGFSSTAFTLTAQNLANATTQNYTGSFAKLGLTSWSNFDFTAASLPAGATLSASATAPTGSWINGVASVTAKHQISRPTALAGETNVTIKAKPVDSDGVTLTTATDVTGSTPLRYGRLSLQNVYGSELLDLAMPLTAQYWNGSGWITNSDDSCTTGVNLSLTDPNAVDGLITSELCAWDTGSPGNSGLGCAVAGSASLQFKEPPLTGSFNLNFKATGAGNTGALDVTATVPSYLQFDWRGAGNANPVARATFGVYKGNTKQIYFREVY